MMASGGDIEQQHSPAVRQRRGLERSMQGERVNFSDYLNAQRKLSSERFLHRQRSIRNLGVLNTLQEEDLAEGAAVETQNVGSSRYMHAPSSRQLHRLQSSEWSQIFDDIIIDDNGHFHDKHAHNLKPLYSPPVQRQRWGDDQVLPHVNWGDLFFDLFYVGMAFNLGVLLKSSMNDEHWLRGIIYFVGVFGSLWTSWEGAMQYESRYVIFDYSHRLFEVIRFLFISTAILHITPIELLSDPSSTECLFVTMSIFLESVMSLLLHLELYVKGKGDRESIRNHTIDNISMRLLPMTVVSLTAAIIALVLFMQSQTDTSYDSKFSRNLGSSEYYDSSVSIPLWKLSDLPLTILAGYYLLNFVTTAWIRRRMYKTMDIRKRFVPSNIEFEIHRYGEWILLMIGEGVLSLLIVATTEAKTYYIITAFGVLTMIFIQILTFESAPHPEGHALWRSYLSGISFSMLNQLLSMSLIIMGLSYKVFLLNTLKEGVSYDEKNRELAASTDIDKSVTAAFYSGSLFVVMVSLELTTVAHTGIKETFAQMYKQGSNELYWPVVISSLLKLGLTIFALTLWTWTIDPGLLSIFGFVVVFFMTVARVVDYVFIHQKDLIEKAAAKVSERLVRPSVVIEQNDDPHQ